MLTEQLETLNPKIKLISKHNLLHHNLINSFLATPSNYTLSTSFKSCDHNHVPFPSKVLAEVSQRGNVVLYKVIQVISKHYGTNGLCALSES